MSSSGLPVRHHAALERLVRFEFRLTCRTGLHIGAGKNTALAGSDLPVIRDGSGSPLVPGSSLRGILRSGLEALSHSIDFDAFARGEDRKASPGVPPDVVKLWEKLNAVQRMFGYVAPGRDEARESGAAFGSRLQISDAVCSSPVHVELRDGVAIARETRTAAGGAKFDLEVVPAGTVFCGQVRFKNPLDHEMGMLAQAFWMLDQGMLLLGGKTARGLGWVEVAVTEPRDLDARRILGGERPPTGRAGDEDFGPVEEKMGRYLETLQSQLPGQEAPASSAP